MEKIETSESSEEYEKKAEEIDNRIREFVGEKCHLSYAAYETDDNDVLINNLDDVVAKGHGLVEAL